MCCHGEMPWPVWLRGQKCYFLRVLEVGNLIHIGEAGEVAGDCLLPLLHIDLLEKERVF